MEKIKIGSAGPLIGKLGLGCMRMSPVWNNPGKSEKESIAAIHYALDHGVQFLNTGDFYGAGHNELLVGKAIKDRRDQAFISVKFGAVFDGALLGFDLRPTSISNFINYSLVRLGVDYIDLYQPCRIDDQHLLEDIVGTIQDLIHAGKVRHLGLSEITPQQLKQAHAIQPVAALEYGYSLANRQLEKELLPLAEKLGISVVAFAITAEGLLTGQLKAPLEANDHRNRFSCFQGENLKHNLEKVALLADMAAGKNCTVAQLAIGWVNAQSKNIMPLISMNTPKELGRPYRRWIFNSPRTN
ncbi:aldo/keto reductase [Arachidicoccus ginsenosidivorans]|uniref:aldo/keto reductase n=1 Tax=Arachidicoccus ginsenosidivorans TaxID=496057 RepID=UPI001CEF69BD|nr:aldo/keto reductase [Arachidicoccus ginsenosidivorans]